MTEPGQLCGGRRYRIAGEWLSAAICTFAVEVHRDGINDPCTAASMVHVLGTLLNEIGRANMTFVATLWLSPANRCADHSYSVC